MEKLRLAIQDKSSLIEEAIFEELQALDFHHRSDRFEVHGYNSVESEGVDISIVAIGDGECTVAFDTGSGDGLRHAVGGRDGRWRSHLPA